MKPVMKTLAVIGLTTMLATPTLSLAAGPVSPSPSSCSLCALVEAVSNVYNTVQETAQNFVKQRAAMAFSHDPYAAQSATGNAARTGNAKNQASTLVTNYASQSLDTLALMQNPGNITKTYAELCGTDFCQDSEGNPVSYTPGSKSNAPDIEKNASFNAAYFIDPKVYNTKNAQMDAAHYVGFISGMASPFVVFDPSDYQNLVNSSGLQNPAVESYRAAVRSYLAQLSMGTDNMLYLFSQRVPQPGLGSLAGYSTSNQSLAQIDEKMAMHRIGSPQWYTDMEQSPPATVARETLYTLAEMRYEMYQERQLQERLLATMTTILLQNTQSVAGGLHTKQSGITDAQNNSNPAN